MPAGLESFCPHRAEPGVPPSGAPRAQRADCPVRHRSAGEAGKGTYAPSAQSTVQRARRANPRFVCRYTVLTRPPRTGRAAGAPFDCTDFTLTMAKFGIFRDTELATDCDQCGG